MIRALLLGVAVALVLGGCGRRFAARCEDPTVYSGSQEIPPVRVPGDLSVPSETDALRIPQSEQLGAAQPATGRGPCLESPPDFLQNGAGTQPEQNEPGA